MKPGPSDQPQPAWGDVHEGKVTYSPLMGGQLGAKGGLVDVETLAVAFIWHRQRGTVSGHEDMPGCGSLPLKGAEWPKYGFDELFLQVAEGWTRALCGDVMDSYSAGIEAHGQNPRAVQVMAEVGIDISQQHSKTVETVRDTEFDLVVTVCGNAHDTCPEWLHLYSRVLHIGFDDPPQLAKDAVSEEEVLQCYRRVRDEIRLFVKRLPETMD